MATNATPTLKPNQQQYIPNNSTSSWLCRLIFITALLFSGVAVGQTVITSSTPGNYTFTIPCDVTALTVEAWGGGGAGGGETANNVGGGGGGAGGAYATSTLTVVPGQVYNLTIGSGGTGDLNAGNNGTGTWFGTVTTVFAQGGQGGQMPTGGRTGGIGSSSLSFGDTLIAGANGLNGTAAVGGNGGNGANPGGGNGGNGGANSNGSNGLAPGGGGGGCDVNNNRDRMGGDGGNGRIRLTYTTNLQAYCTPDIIFDIEPITSVIYAGIINQTSDAVNGAPVSESFCNIANVTVGSSNTLTVKGNTAGNYTNFFTVYIDWDQDGVFGSDINEFHYIGTITNSTGLDTQEIIYNISVPASAALGLTKMRIIKDYFFYIDGCGDSGDIWFGQSEDYVINVTSCTSGDGNGTTALACPSVLTGGLGLNGSDPAAIDCASSTCVEIEATYLELGDTSIYRVEGIDYNPPYQFNCLANPVSVDLDDVWSPVVNLPSSPTPFDFCFYGTTYNSVVIGSNGILSFNNGLANGQTGWEINNNIPSFVNGTSYGPTTNYYYGPSIFGAHHDIDPSIGGQIGWELITLNTGCRALVAAWHDVPMYDPNYYHSILYSGMIVLYENTNVIEIYIEEKNLSQNLSSPYPPIWNNGRAQLGIQEDGANGLGAPSRNDVGATWSTNQEAWRFVPDGNPITTLKWYANAISPANEIIDPNNDGVIEVCPNSTTTYFAEVTYNLCNGNGTLVEVDQTTVTVTGGKVWNGSTSNDWNNANNWTPVGVPDPTNCVVIPDAATSNNDAIVFGTVDGDGLNLTVQDAGSLLIESNGTLTIVDYVDVQGAGTFHLEDSASLIQVNDFPSIANVGEITLDRTANIRRTDYVYWSSPVEDFQIQNISTNTPNGYKYRWIPTMFQGTGPPGDLVFGDWEAYNSGLMEIGRGYIVRGPNGAPYNNTTPQDFTATFEGTPNNGLIIQPIRSGDHDSGPYTYQPTPGVFLDVTNADDNWNLIGNPYPSALDPEAFLSYGANSHIEGAVHLWTHGTDIYTNPNNVNPFYENFGLNYNPDDYITYNKTGSSNYPETFNGKIASGQGFFIMALNNDEMGNVTFSNSMRSKNHDNNNFFRTDESGNTVEQNVVIEKHRIWLNLISPDEQSSSTLIGYVEGATFEKDRLFDASNLETNTLNLYSIIGEDRMVIQGRPVPFDVNDQVPLGAEITSTGIYTIAIRGVDGLFSNENQNIFLEDTHLGIIHNLRGAPYIFTVDVPLTFEDRFILRYTNQTLGIEDPSLNSGINILSYNNEIKVTSANNPINTIMIYDVLGRILADYKDVNALEFKIQGIYQSKGTLIVKATLYNGKQKIKKVIH